MGPKLMNCCRPEQMDTKEFGKIAETDERSMFLEPCHRMCLNSVRTRLCTSSTVTQQGKTTPAVYNVYTRSDPPEEDKIPPE